MKILCLLFFNLVLLTTMNSQDRKAMDIHRMHEVDTWHELILREQSHTNDTTIDVKFYHIDIEIAIDSAYIAGSVLCRFEPAEGGISELFLDLSQALTVTDISAPCESFYQDEDKILIELSNNVDPGESVDLTIFYEGVPVMPGGYKGLRYETHNGGEPVIATLSTPYLAHFWYPCKDGPEDKADSVYIDITIDKSNVNGLEMIAVSNGVLEDTVSMGDKKTFKWRHGYPIVTYYVMAAISNYIVINDEFSDGSGISFPLEYFVFGEGVFNQEAGVEDIPDVIEFFNNTFGTYPFADEKFGMTQLGYYGAIENQTNVIQNTMEPGWFMISVHELAHMWFGDMITCETWHHGWLNEGFATYAEALWVEQVEGMSAYHTYMNSLQYVGGGTLYLEETDDPFGIFIPIIYDKGAWALHMLRGVVGDTLFFQSLKNYALDTDLMYMNANTEQLQDVFENTTGMDLDYFFEQWIYDEYYPIYSYNFIQEPDDRLFVAIYQSQEEFYDRRPVFEMPVPIHILFTDGSDTSIVVNNDEQWQQFSFPFSKEVSWVDIDPDKWILRETFYWDEVPVGIEEETDETFVKLYPNPAGDKIIIKISESSMLPLQLELYDVGGKKVKVKQLNVTLTQLDISGLEKGIYVYRIQGENQPEYITGKLIKE